MKKIHFSKNKPDLRRRQSILDFLQGHYRYDTMGSHNHATSYAQCVKIHRLPLTEDQRNVAYDLLSVECSNAFSFMSRRIREFTEQQGGRFTVGSNGRSSGYLVLYQSEYKASEYKSICTDCGQRNFREVYSPEGLSAQELGIAQLLCRRANLYSEDAVLADAEFQALAVDPATARPFIRRWLVNRKSGGFDTRCGVCHNESREPYSARELKLYPGRSLDQDEAFDADEWTMPELVARARLVMAFDALCDDLLNDFIELTSTHKVVTKTVMVPKEICVLEPA